MEAAYDAPANRRPQTADLTPAGFSAQGMVATVSDLLIERDIYYRAESVSNEGGGFPSMEVDEGHRLHEALKDPQLWGQLYEDFSRKAQFNELGSDEFFVMGDNSPRSQDSRLWPNQRRALNRHAVGRQALIGKAFFIYWPHGVPFMNDGRGYNVIGHMPVSYENTPDERKEAAAYPEYSVPFYPQWWRWKRIR
jgi:signal peptidase I